MKLVIACLAALALAPGCLWANRQSDSMTGYGALAMLGPSGDVEGGEVHALTGYAGLYAEADGNVRDVDRPTDPSTYKAVTVGLAVRASLFGVLATDHKLERYLDLGGAAGADAGAVLGVPPHGIAGTGAGWYGAWVDVGTVSIGSGYLALTGSVRREVFGDPWNDRTQLLIGLAWRQRAPVTDRDLSWHD